MTGDLSVAAFSFIFQITLGTWTIALVGLSVRANGKLLRNYDDGSLELYNLSKDLSEKSNLVRKEQALARRLNGELTQVVERDRSTYASSPTQKWSIALDILTRNRPLCIVPCHF